MKKFYLSFVAMFFAAVTASAEDFMYEGLAYNILNENIHSVEVTTPTAGYTNLGGDLVIPKTVYNNGQGYGVVSIGKRAFRNCTAITSVTIPSSVEIIGQEAFWQCTNLATINFAQNSTTLKEIGQSAFRGTAITSATVPDGVKRIFSSAFQDCPNLTTVILPNGMEELSTSSFADCTKLTTVNLPEGIYYIRGTLFSGCTSLKSVTIPKSVKVIEEQAFLSSGLTSITIPSNVERINARAFAECKNLTTVTIPSTVTDIASGLFRDCTGLTSVNIQNNTIDEYEFNGCTSLKTVTIGSNLNNLDVRLHLNYGAFVDCPIETLNVGSILAANIALYPAAKSTLKTLNLTDGVTDLPESAFEGCSELEKVTLPSGLKSIGNAAFKNCTRMGDLYAKMAKPFAIDASVFSGVQQHGYCDLHVPQGSKVRYAAMEVWKEFTIITEDAGSAPKRGDVNEDGDVTIADVVAVLNIMAGQ